MLAPRNKTSVMLRIISNACINFSLDTRTFPKMAYIAIAKINT